MIEDTVIIPKDLAPGKYVLGWRWDCEETAQVSIFLSSPHIELILTPPQPPLKRCGKIVPIF